MVQSEELHWEESDRKVQLPFIEVTWTAPWKHGIEFYIKFHSNDFLSSYFTMDFQIENNCADNTKRRFDSFDETVSYICNEMEPFIEGYMDIMKNNFPDY